jgi:hypothetical protein
MVAAGALAVGLVMTGCSSGGSSATATTGALSPPTKPTSPPATSPSSTPTTAAATTSAATCPTVAQAEAALGGTYADLSQTSTPGGGSSVSTPVVRRGLPE